MRYVSAAAAAVGSVLALGTAPASAAPAEPVANHCMAEIGNPSSEKCFATFQEAREYFVAMGGQMGEPKGGAPGARAAQANLGVIPTLIEIAYDWNYQNPLGGTYWFWRNNGGCTSTTADLDYTQDPMPSGWVNRVSSSTLFSHCWAKHFEDPSFGGASDGYRGSAGNLNVGTNDKVSSIKWS
ncbi:hypothetical protein [Nucisporomicrobium flavum]|uniref:hypothetical protein n=1 Tax=Nucisporomicrobium flavum TaxID=2785915 RepID=UPI0018F4A1F6|nr:hypothetical protein [Nucisporomicrobium flavum]